MTGDVSPMAMFIPKEQDDYVQWHHNRNNHEGQHFGLWGATEKYKSNAHFSEEKIQKPLCCQSQHPLTSALLTSKTRAPKSHPSAQPWLSSSLRLFSTSCLPSLLKLHTNLPIARMTHIKLCTMRFQNKKGQKWWKITIHDLGLQDTQSVFCQKKRTSWKSNPTD